MKSIQYFIDKISIDITQDENNNEETLEEKDIVFLSPRSYNPEIAFYVRKLPSKSCIKPIVKILFSSFTGEDILDPPEYS